MKVIALPCSFDNYAYLLICEKSGEAAVVDPAEFYPVFCAVEEHGVVLKAVYCTHHHADHIGGLADLLGECPGLDVYAYESDSARIPAFNRPLGDGDRILVGEEEGEVIYTPGHTSGSICYRFGEHLFTGDTMFGAGCGRLFEGSPAQMYASLNEKLKPLPGQTRVYFGHEYTGHNLKFAKFVDPDNSFVDKRIAAVEQQRGQGGVTTPSTLGLECATNPFLRCEEEGIKRSVAEKGIGESLDSLSVFTALRRLKDGF